MSLRKTLCSVDFKLRLAVPCLQAPCTPTAARVATFCACTLPYRLGCPAGSCLTAAAATGATTAATAGCGGHNLAGPRAGGGARVGWEGWASRWWASRHRMPCASCQHSYNVCILGFLLNISLAIFVILTISYYPLRSGPCIHGAPTGPRHQRSSACVFLFKKTEATIPGTPSIRHFFRRVLILDFASMYLCRHDCKPMGALAVLPRIILIGRCGGHVGTSHDWSAYQP